VKNLISEHHELTQLEQEYNQKTQLMKYRYPDVGITEKRKYERIKIKSIDDYEEMMGIEGEVKKSVEKIKEHYGIEDEASNDKTQKNSDSHNPDDPNYLAQPIILKK
ncbi:MAG: hypothetical protein KDD45_14890, partial [Bdellovibrionales bacterium]|nr:hypothetical protein [Bdellovibrionales bacterium]